MRRKIVKALGALLVLVLLFAVLPFCYIFFKTLAYTSNSIDSLPQSQAVVILGAGILGNGNLSPVLEDRALTALEVYTAKKAPKILISGNSTSSTTNEVGPIKSFLLHEGVPAADIITDIAGLDTYTSMYRAKNIYNLNSIIIATQRFHEIRAVYIARSLGIDAYGISADRGGYIPKNYFREWFAEPKAIIDVLSHRIP